MAEADAGEVACQDPMGVQRSLGLTRGARRIDHQGGIFGQGLDRVEVVRLSRQEIVEAEHGSVASVDRDHGFKRGRAGPDRGDLGGSGRIRDHEPDGRVGEPIRERIGAEDGRQRQHDRAELIGRNLGHDHRGALGQEHSDAVTRSDAKAPHRVAEPVRALTQRTIGRRFGPCRISVEDGDTLGIEGGPTVADIPPHVVEGRDRPAECRRRGLSRMSGRVDHDGSRWQIASHYRIAVHKTQVAWSHDVAMFEEGQHGE